VAASLAIQAEAAWLHLKLGLAQLGVQGPGKTLAPMWIAERLESERTLVLVPRFLCWHRPWGCEGTDQECLWATCSTLAATAFNIRATSRHFAVAATHPLRWSPRRAEPRKSLLVRTIPPRKTANTAKPACRPFATRCPTPVLRGLTSSGRALRSECTALGS
jgi:hypothetical protein